MTKKIVSIITAMLMVLCFAACGQEEQSDKAYELDGVGVDDILTLEIPEGYEELDVAQNGYGTDAEIISQSWTNEDSTLWISMLSYNGKGVLGKDGSLEDYIEPESIDDIVALNSPQPDAYISYGGGTAEDGTNIENNTIEAVFSYEDYVLSLDMENNNEQSITDEQKETFYNVLESIEFRSLAEEKPTEEICGTWQYYGMIPCDADYQANLNEADIITGQEFTDTFGADVPDQTITITEDGVKEYQNIKGSRITAWKKDEQANDQWLMTVEITQLVGEEPLETPLHEEVTFTLRDGYLFEDSHIDSDEYDDSDYVNVYTKAGE